MSELHQHALELISQGDWDAAHHLIQNYNDKLACLIHGYLHRKEGDLGNASYWYTQAGHTMPNNTLEQEFDRLSQLLNHEGN
jgi:hypothetical protein